MVQIARNHLENFSTDKELRSKLACKSAWFDAIRMNRDNTQCSYMPRLPQRELDPAGLIYSTEIISTCLPSTGQSFSVHCHM